MNTLAPPQTRRNITVDECYRVLGAGILTEGDRIEPIDGEILDMAPIGADHINAVNDLNRALVVAIGDHGTVSVQNPLRLDIYNEPMPDVLLVVEVAKTSLCFDNRIKLPKCAAAGIPEVCIIDVAKHRLHKHRDPQGSAHATTWISTPKDTRTLARVPDAKTLFARILF